MAKGNPSQNALILRLVFRYPISFCGPEITPKFQNENDYSGWKSFAQLFNPFVKTKDIVVTFGRTLTMVPRCITSATDSASADSSAFVLVLLLNREVVEKQFQIESFEMMASRVRSRMLSHL